MVVQNWNVGIDICTMDVGKERDDLLCFRRLHRNGNKYIHQYIVEEVEVPGEYRLRPVLRRLEKSKDAPHDLVPGHVVISREELFDAIDEWHHQNGHLGQERTWQ